MLSLDEVVAMAYYRDLTKMTLSDLKDLIQSEALIPSWQILKEEISLLDRLKFHNLEEMFNVLKTKKKAEVYAGDHDLPLDYIVVLRRFIMGLKPSPNRLCDLPISKVTIQVLHDLGYRNTLDVYDKLLTHDARTLMAKETGISIQEFDMLIILADLSRIRWVNHTFSYVLYKLGYTVKKLQTVDGNILYRQVLELNERDHLYGGHIGLRDMELLVHLSKQLTIDIDI